MRPTQRPQLNFVVAVESLSHIWLFATPWIVARQAPLSVGFPRQEYWNGLPFAPPGIFPTQGWNPHLLYCQGRFFITEPSGKLPVTLSLLISSSVMSDSLQPWGLENARLPCPSPSPGACSNSCPLSWWCHPMISSSIVPFSSCLQSFPASGSFLLSWLFPSVGQSIGASASASVLSMNI